MRKPVPFGKYCLLERISVGGMAEVFKAKQFGAEGFAKTIAIKRILPNMAEDDEFIMMFIDEAKIAVMLNHANICQIYELGKIFNSHYIVMEYIPGKDLLQLNNHFKRSRKQMPLEMACYIVSKVCEGLDYAHRKRDQNFEELLLVHRDISPQNVLVSYGGEVKIIDFGIAKATTRSTKTQVGVLKGKFGYMSPEQVRGLPLDRRSDIFAAGTVLYEILTAKRLFVADTDFATLEKVRKVDIEPPTTLRPDIPEELERIILKALARERDERYTWASEFQEDLQRFLVSSSKPYASHQMSEWMNTTFDDVVTKEKEKDEYYATIRSPEDLRDEDEPPDYDPLDVDQLDDRGDSTVIYAHDGDDADPRPDYDLLNDELRADTPPAEAPVAALTEEFDRPPDDPGLGGFDSDQVLSPSDDEPTQAVSSISDEQFEDMMASPGEGPRVEEPDEGAAPTPLAIPRKPSKFAANTMALSVDEIEVLVEDDMAPGPIDLSDLGDPVPPPGAPLGDLFDSNQSDGRVDTEGSTIPPSDPLPAIPRDPLPKIPVRVKNPEPVAAPPAPVADPELAAAPMVFGETMNPVAVSPSAGAMPPPAAAPPPPAPAPPPAIESAPPAPVPAPPAAPPAPDPLPPPPAPPPPVVPAPGAEIPAAPVPAPAGPTPFAEQGTGPTTSPTGKRGRLLREIIIGTVVAGVILAGGIGAWWFFRSSGPPIAPGTASLLIEVVPAEDLEIKLDGKKVATASPARLDGLSPGRHKLEIRAEGRLPHKIELELPDGELSKHEAELEEGELPAAQLKLDIRPRGPGTTISLEGASFRYDPDGPSGWMDLTAGEPHTVIITRRGFRTAMVDLTLQPDEKKVYAVQLKELSGTILLSSKPAGARVFLNDRKVGKTPFKKKNMKATKIYDVMLSKKGFEDWVDTIEFTSDAPVYKKSIELIRKGKRGRAGSGGTAASRSSSVGYLTVSAGTDVWAKVFVDGKDTGQSTPIQSYNKLELPVGPHTVTLKLGDKTVNKPVEIRPGETTKLRTRIR